MKTANVADLRNNFSTIAAWEPVAITKWGKLFAMLSPVEEPPRPKVDFAEQLKRIWGDKVFTDDEVRHMREAEKQLEESDS